MTQPRHERAASRISIAQLIEQQPNAEYQRLAELQEICRKQAEDCQKLQQTLYNMDWNVDNKLDNHNTDHLLGELRRKAAVTSEHIAQTLADRFPNGSVGAMSGPITGKENVAKLEETCQYLKVEIENQKRQMSLRNSPPK